MIRKTSYSLLIVLIIFMVLGCKLTPPDSEYSVLYYGNGNDYGYPPTDNNKYTPGMTATILGINTLGKEDHTFQEWNTASDSSGIAYQPGETIEIKHSTVFLYAIWSQ